MAKAESTAVATKEETNLALANQFTEDSGAGFEETSAESFAIPFLSILQSGSPQVKKSDGAYIKGAEEGMLYNSVTGEIFSGEEGVEVIPCHYTHRYIEWKLREAGGGFVGEHLPDDPIVATITRDDKGRNITANGTQLSDTRNHYVLIRTSGGLTPAIMSLSSSQLKKSRKWMSMMQGQKVKNPATGMFQIAPMYSTVYKVTTVPESNDKGSWFGYNFEIAGKVTDLGEYMEAKNFAHAVKSGMTKVERNMETEAPSNEKAVNY
jgi:hypothetical protein